MAFVAGVLVMVSGKVAVSAIAVAVAIAEYLFNLSLVLE